MNHEHHLKNPAYATNGLEQTISDPHLIAYRRYRPRYIRKDWMNGGREQQGVRQRRNAGRGTRRQWSAVPGKNDCHLYKQEAIIKMKTNQNNFKLDTIVSWVPKNKIVKFEVNSIKGWREIQHQP